MPYALIPDGYTLKSVTKLQKQALTEKRRHDDVVALLNNENTPLVLGGLVAGFFAVQTSKSVITELEGLLGELSDDVKGAIETGVAKVEKELITDPKSWFERKIDIVKLGVSTVGQVTSPTSLLGKIGL
jgi:hypothetical protein